MQLAPPGDAVAVNERIAPPPSFNGIAQVTTREPERGSTATDRGALGAEDADVTGFGITPMLDAEVEPPALRAATVT